MRRISRVNRICIAFAFIALVAAAVAMTAHYGSGLTSGHDRKSDDTTPGRDTYRLSHTYKVGGEGGWDYISLDSDARRLYVAHGDQVEVLDADSGKPVGRIDQTPGVHGVAIASEFHRGFSSNGKDNTVTVFDTRTLATVQTVQLRGGTDFILYDPFSKRVFPMDEKVTVLEARTGGIVGVLGLGGETEAAVSDGAGKIFVNLKDKVAVAIVDSLRLQVVGTYPIPNCLSPHSLSRDGINQRLFVGCQNGLAVLDAQTGKLVGWSPICSGVDGSAYDPDAKLIFESCGEGVMSVVRQLDPNFYTLTEAVPTELWAKTMAFDPRTKRIYLPTADFEVTRSTDPKYPLPFVQKIKADTFRILVLGKN